MVSHLRYWSAHKYRGTQPRLKTIRSYNRQVAKGFPITGRIVCIIGNRVLHPTKGWRKLSV